MHVTVIIPAWNVAKYLGEAIRSVFKQTYQNWDLIVVDDGSTDGTSKVVERFAPGRPVSLIQFEKHQGLPKCLDLGIRRALGPIITWMGGDDKLLPNSLSTGVKTFAQNPNLVYVWTKFQSFGGKIGWSRPLPDGYDSLWEAICVKGWWKACCQQFFRKEDYLKTRGMDFDVPYATDLQLAILLAELGGEARHVPVVTYLYRTPRPGSITTSKRSAQLRSHRELVKRSLRYMGTRGRKGLFYGANSLK